MGSANFRPCLSVSWPTETRGRFHGGGGGGSARLDCPKKRRRRPVTSTTSLRVAPLRARERKYLDTLVMTRCAGTRAKRVVRSPSSFLFARKGSFLSAEPQGIGIP